MNTMQYLNKLTRTIRCHVARHIGADITFAITLLLAAGADFEFASLTAGLIVAASLSISYHCKGAFWRYLPFAAAILATLFLKLVGLEGCGSYLGWIFLYAAGVLIHADIFYRAFGPHVSPLGTYYIVVWPGLYAIGLIIAVACLAQKLIRLFQTWRRVQLIDCGRCSPQ